MASLVVDAAAASALAFLAGCAPVDAPHRVEVLAAASSVVSEQPEAAAGMATLDQRAAASSAPIAKAGAK